MDHIQKQGEAFPRLFSPFRLGGHELQNRIAVLPHGTSMVVDGGITDADIAYYEKRARTRPGMIVTGAAVVDPGSARRQRILVENYNEAVLPGLERRAAMMRSHDVIAIGQLIHLGREMIGAESDFPPVAPSFLRSPRDPFPPQVLDGEEIGAIVESFARCAANLERTGHHGAEIHAAHGYLPAQFLSPATNQRDDAYGGNEENRFRFLAELVEAIRAECSASFLLGIRLSADEEIADGLTIPDTRRIVGRLEDLGGVDYVSITLGTRGAYVKDTSSPEMPSVRAAGLIKSDSTIPVLVGQKILRPEQAESILAEGSADIVGMARAMIAEPRWIDLARTDRFAEARPCIGVNQDCRAFNPHLHCAVNPSVGRELSAPFDDTGKAGTLRKIAIVGGGPAGLEAARSAALKGHSVTLHEAGEGTGGQFLVAASVPHRQGLARLLDFYSKELRRLAVDVRLKSRVDDLSALSGYDDVIVATGAEPQPLPDEFAAGGALHWWDILTEGAPPPVGSGHALMVDDGTGFWWNYGVAEALAEAGWRITYATPSAAVGHQIPHESVGPLLGRLGRSGISFLVLHELIEVGEGAATLINMASGATLDIPCDATVIQTGRKPVNPPAGEPEAAIHRIGDSVTPRRMANAVFEGQRLAMSL